MIKEFEPRALDFEEQKRKFFIKLGLRSREWLKAHQKLGALWEGPKYMEKGGKKVEQRWENVSEHCLVEAARADEFAGLLKLSEQSKDRLFAGAVLHDFNKKNEILDTAKADRTPESFDIAYGQATKKLTDAGVDPLVVEISDSVGHATAGEMEKILAKPELNEHDISRLVMHYIDDYTLATDWVAPYDGQANDLDRRMDANDTNPKYAKIAEAGFYKEQRRVGYLVERRLSQLISQRSGEIIEPKKLPEYVDKKIKEQINQA